MAGTGRQEGDDGGLSDHARGRVGGNGAGREEPLMLAHVRGNGSHGGGVEQEREKIDLCC